MKIEWKKEKKRLERSKNMGKYVDAEYLKKKSGIEEKVKKKVTVGGN